MPQEIPYDMLQRALERKSSGGRGATEDKESSQAGRGSVIPYDMIQQRTAALKKEEEKQHTEGLKREAKEVVRPVLKFGKEFGQGAAAGPYSTAGHAADWIRSSIASVWPWYRRQLEEADKRYAAATPEQRATMTPGLYAHSPEARALMTPPNTAAGHIGFGVEQAGEEFALGALVPEVEGAGLLKTGARLASGAGTGGLVSGMQTGSWEGARKGAALGAGGAVIGEFGRFGAPRAAERELFPKGVKRGEEAEAKAAAERYVGTKGMKKATEAGIEEEIAKSEAQIEKLVKSHPVYSERTIPIDDVLRPVRKQIQELRDAGKTSAATALEKKAAEWAKQLGFEEAVAAEAPGAARQVERVVKGPKGETLYDIIPGKPGTAAKPAQTMTTIEKANELAKKIALDKSKTAQGLASGVKGVALEAIPEEKAVIESAHEAIVRDSLLKKAILSLPGDKSAKIRNAALILGGEFGADMVARGIEYFAPKHKGAAEGVRVAAGAAALISYAGRKPGGLTQLLLILRREGAYIPPAVEAAFRQGMREAAKAGGEDEEQESAWGPKKPEAEAKPAALPKPEKKESPFKGASITPQMNRWVEKSAHNWGVPPVYLKRVMRQESGGNPQAVSPKGAVGLMQFMPDTARQYGVDPMDPQQAIDGAAHYLSDLREKTGSWELALAAYNAGPGAVDKYKGIPPYKETRKYVSRVTGGG